MGAPPQVPMVTVTPPMASVMVGQQIQLAATVTGGTGPVTWSSSNAAVATVNATGLVMAFSLGQVTITATSGGGSGTAALTTTTGIVFATVTTGSNHTCGLTPGGVAYCWGANSSGQLGDGTVTDSATPVAVSGALSFASITAGGNHTCGSTSGLVAYCWGDNTFGQLGDGSTTNSAAPVAVMGGLQLAGLSAGTGHTCGMGGFIYCWGNNSSGQLGNGSLINSSVPVATAFGGWTFVSAGSNHTCANAFSGGLTAIVGYFCWGDNSSGQLGNGTMTSSAVPVFITSSGLAGYIFSTGSLYTCAALGPADLAGVPVSSCWGANGSGQLGNGTTMNSATPVAIAGGLNFYAVSAGGQHACGLFGTFPPPPSQNGAPPTTSVAYCWGDNSSGQLGNGTMTSNTTPSAVAGGLNFGSLSAGGSHTCAVILNNSISPNAGAVYCWGDNSHGQLGNSWTTSSSVPVNVAGSP
jgi:alpha-tubulin suppressor-like RCC1 family protein